VPLLSSLWAGSEADGHPGWLEQDLKILLQGELDLPLRSKATGRTIVRITSAVSRLHVKVSSTADRSSYLPSGKGVSRAESPPASKFLEQRQKVSGRFRLPADLMVLALLICRGLDDSRLLTCDAYTTCDFEIRRGYLTCLLALLYGNYNIAHGGAEWLQHLGPISRN
jgi:hypothetical protein